MSKNLPVSSIVKHNAICAGGVGSIPGPVKTQCCQRLATTGTFIRWTSGAEMDPVTRYTLRRNTASMMKIRFFLLSRGSQQHPPFASMADVVKQLVYLSRCVSVSE